MAAIPRWRASTTGGKHFQMDLSDFLTAVATGYDRHAGLNTPTQELLRRADAELSEHVAGGYFIQGSGGRGTATLSPWVGIFDQDETTTPQQGIYVVYLFAEDLSTVSLSVQQGITSLSNALGGAAAREQLASDAAAIRTRLGDAVAGLEEAMHLGSSGTRQRGYEAGTIVAITYSTESLPAEGALRADLSRIIHVYELAVSAKRELRITGEVATPSPVLNSDLDDPLRDFKPKNDGEYVSHVIGRSLVKSRRHERLVADFGDWAYKRGWLPSTKDHPIDLMLRGESGAWLVEAKIVYHGNVASAVRACVGQLYEYHHFLKPDSDLLALFSEPIEEAFVAYLEACGIASVWRDSGTWAGSAATQAAHLS